MAHSPEASAMCCTFFCLIFVIPYFAGAVLAMLVNIGPSSPETTLESIYFPSLDKNVNSSTDTTLTFKIKIKNRNWYRSLYYDPLNITFYDSPNRVHSIANLIVPSFHQDGMYREAQKDSTINTYEFDREAAMHNSSVDGYWIIRVDLATSFRFHYIWTSRTHGYTVGADVKIGDTGIKAHHKDPAELTSSAVKIGSTIGRIGFFMLNLIVAWFLCSY